VGDVYLLLNTLWGCGKRPLFVATAKTVYISGHWRTERALIRNFTLKTWTRDQPTASQLGGNSKYSGSPIMDLLGDAKVKKGNVILLLPGSRKSANNDVKTLLAAVEIMFQHGHDKFRMVLAPTLDFQAFFESCESEGWTRDSQSLNKNEIKISLTTDEIAKSCNDACVLLGMGGTANQLCAGLGVPVIAPDNKGKRVQKKLLGDAEILTSSSPQALAECALAVLSDSGLYDFMSRTGRSRMGMPGACDDVIKTTSGEMGWKLREIVYSKLL
ncbi:MAG: tetraacyldisaccharide 4'-kinase, partial [Synergistaceae bacterium]|nr:tetraacyldisaccharide 4'-kinase [Synergistaceae bacterium]